MAIQQTQKDFDEIDRRFHDIDKRVAEGIRLSNALSKANPTRGVAEGSKGTPQQYRQLLLR